MANKQPRKKRPLPKFSRSMRKKLMVLFTVVMLCLCALVGRLMYIGYTSGEKYEKKVLSMQSYDSAIIPFQRGDIIDRTGTVLATSVAVYNVIMDCSVMTSSVVVNGEKVQRYIEPTINALLACFPDLDKETLMGYVNERPDSRYIILKKRLPIDEIKPFLDMQEAVDEDGNKLNPYIKGVWFEKEYLRSYPFNELACSVLGFVSSGNVGTVGLENYYNDVLNGVNGREYGYLNADSDFEKTVISPQDGHTVISTIDANIQSIVEAKIKEFNDAYRDNHTEGDGSANTAVIIMNPNTGEILAMAEYPSFNLNDPRDLTGIMTEEEAEAATDEEKLEALNAIWKNYCITETYEPGSVQKPFTIASGLETGTLNTDLTFVCDGHEKVGVHTIHCVKRAGHGVETLEKTLMDSCNDAIMQMTYLIGKERFVKYQGIFNFGQKTGIDIPGEANTAGLIYTLDKMTNVDLATNAFGQNYNATMIQIISAFSSLINGGSYYQPHLVSKIVDAKGGTVELIEPTLLKQTVSKGTSEILKGYLKNTVADGTASYAKVDGYSMGGKTGTAEKLPRGNDEYLVSFLGYVPYEQPQLAIYCVVDEPNSVEQDHSYYAQNIVREILEEVLPYMNIYPDEELTGTNAELGIIGKDPFYHYTTDDTDDDNNAADDNNVDDDNNAADNNNADDNNAPPIP